MKHDYDRGWLVALARILVDGDPTVRISDIRRVMTVIKDGNAYDAAALYLLGHQRPACRRENHLRAPSVLPRLLLLSADLRVLDPHWNLAVGGN